MISDKDLFKIGQAIDSSLDNRLGAMEQRLVTQFRIELSTALTVTEKRLTHDIGSLLSDNLIPQIDEKANQEQVDKLSDRLGKIELLPIIAHQLKK